MNENIRKIHNLSSKFINRRLDAGKRNQEFKGNHQISLITEHTSENYTLTSDDYMTQLYLFYLEVTNRSILERKKGKELQLELG